VRPPSLVATIRPAPAAQPWLWPTNWIACSVAMAGAVPWLPVVVLAAQPEAADDPPADDPPDEPVPDEPVPDEPVPDEPVPDEGPPEAA
jgi:hypothetical protein